MKKLILFFFAAAMMIAACANKQSSNNESGTDSTEDSVTTTVAQEQPQTPAYVPKYKSVKDALDACGVDSFWIKYFPITIHINSKECYIWPPIGETTLAINPFPIVEYLVENQTKNPPFVIRKYIGPIGYYHDGGEIWISTFKKGKRDLDKIIHVDTTECHTQTFSPGFENFYRLLKIYHSNYLTQEKYYEGHHKFIED